MIMAHVMLYNYSFHMGNIPVDLSTTVAFQLPHSLCDLAGSWIELHHSGTLLVWLAIVR